MIKFALAGWNEGTKACLDALLNSSLTPEWVYVPAEFEYSDFAHAATARGIPVKVLEKKEPLYHTNLDFLLSSSWPYRISKEQLNLFPKGVLNLHSSLLPKYRGCHPLNWALINDEPELGVTVHYMAEGLDDGDICLQEKFQVSDSDTLLSVRERCHTLGPKLLAKAVHLLMRGDLPRTPQDPQLASLAPRRTPEQGQLVWNFPSRNIFAFIRAIAEPAPGAYTFINGEKLVVWQARIVSIPNAPRVPGEILEVGSTSFKVATADRATGIEILRWESSAALKPGLVLGAS